MVYVFDGSMDGLLTAIFQYYERKPDNVRLVPDSYYQPSAFDESLLVISDDPKAKRVWAGLAKKLSPEGLQRFYSTWLSEQPESFQHLFDFARYIFDRPAGAESDYGNAEVLAVAQMDRKVHREKHRMEAFVRFQKTADGLYYAAISPDFNVLPLIARHFKERYADQQWVIYDLKRKYGIHYDLVKVQEIQLDLQMGNENSAGIFDQKEGLYTRLWQDYFRSTNIPARENRKLHLQHVPLRYWKYLTEKQG